MKLNESKLRFGAMILVVIGVQLLSMPAFSIGKPKPVTGHNSNSQGPGVGNFSQDRAVVRRLMTALEIPQGQIYPGSNLTYENLLLKLMKFEREWLKGAMTHFESQEFKDSPDWKQDADRFQFQVHVRYSVEIYKILEAPKFKTQSAAYQCKSIFG